MGGGLVVKSTVCSSRGPGFDSSHLCGGSQPPVTPVPGDLLPASDLGGPKHAYGTQTYVKATHLCI